MIAIVKCFILILSILHFIVGAKSSRNKAQSRLITQKCNFVTGQGESIIHDEQTTGQ